MEDSKDSTPSEESVKHPFKILKIAIDRIVNLAIPLHLRTLKNQCENIQKYRLDHNWIFLHNEQINASNTVRLLKSDIHELEGLNSQVKDEDRDKFLKAIQSPTREVVDALVAFLDTNSDVMQPLPQFDEDGSSDVDNIPELICDPTKEFSENSGTVDESSNALSQVQIQEKPVRVLKHWEKLRNDIIELNELFRRFASSVFGQKGSVDTIENHVQQATENAISGTKNLKRAVALQAAILPFAGAAIGGLLGPIGAVVGFKLCGSLACALGGSVVGFGVGRKIKYSRIASCDMEMKAIAASSTRLSNSTPDLLLASDIKEIDSNMQTDSKKNQ